MAISCISETFQAAQVRTLAILLPVNLDRSSELILSTCYTSLHRVLRLKRRYRDIGSTTIVLLPKLANMVVLLFVVYYFYAIVGIEAFNGGVFKGCW